MHATTKNRIGIGQKTIFQYLCCYGYQKNNTNFAHHCAKLPPCVAIAVRFLKGYFFIGNLNYIFVISIKEIFNKNISKFPEIE